MVTVPPSAVAGTTTEVSTGSSAVGSVDPVVTVPPWASTDPEAVSPDTPPACGVTAFDEGEGALVPRPFVALTVKVYVTPLLRPPTSACVTFPATVAIAPPGATTIEYDVMAEPPVQAGADQDTAATPSPAAATTWSGGDGGPGSGTKRSVVKLCIPPPTISTLPRKRGTARRPGRLPR